MREDLVQPGTRALDQFREESLRRAIAITEECERWLKVRGGDAVDANVCACLRAKDHEACDVQAVESAKGHERICGVDQAIRAIHRRQQCTQPRLLPLGERRQDHEGRLRRHTDRPMMPPRKFPLRRDIDRREESERGKSPANPAELEAQP